MAGYTIDDVADGIVAKLIRRHPHVFADVTVSGAEDVHSQLGRDQRAERGEKGTGRTGRPARWAEAAAVVA